MTTVVHHRMRDAGRDMRPHATRAASLLKALANPQRLLILCHLAAGPLSVGDLNERVALSQSALSQHLAVLRAAGIVVGKRAARHVRYRLANGIGARITGQLHAHFCHGLKHSRSC